MKKYLIAENYRSNNDYYYNGGDMYDYNGGEILVLPASKVVAKYLSRAYIWYMVSWGAMKERPDSVSYNYAPHMIADGFGGSDGWDKLVGDIWSWNQDLLPVWLKDERLTDGSVPITRMEEAKTKLSVSMDDLPTITFSGYFKHTNVAFESPDISLNTLRKEAGMLPYREGHVAYMRECSRVGRGIKDAPGMFNFMEELGGNPI